MLNLLMLSLYILLNIYIIWRIGMWFDFAFSFHIKVNRVLKIAAAIVCISASSTLLLWLLFPGTDLAVFLIRKSNYWLGFFIEMTTCLIISDLAVFLLWLIFRKHRHEFRPTFHKIYGGAVLAAALLLTVTGCINAEKIRVRSCDITVEKKCAAVDEMKVVLIADTHMGYSVGCRRIEKMVEKCREAQPDLVLIAGDIFDNNYDALDDPERLEELFRQLNPRYGVYAVYGNHDVKAELVGGFTVAGTRLRDPRMDQFLKDSHITLLQDETATIAEGSVYLTGRLDGEHAGTAEKRKPLEELIKGLDPDKPLLMMNHEPVQLDTYAAEHVDVLFSGHTHDGQFFPLTLMNFFAWENAAGCKKIGDMYSIVTSGVGVYGPNMRLFTEAEIMEINIHFELRDEV